MTERRTHITLAGPDGAIPDIPATLIGSGNLAVHRGGAAWIRGSRGWTISQVHTGYAVAKRLRTRTEALKLAHKLDARGGKLWDFGRLSQFRRRRRELSAIMDECGRKAKS